MLCTYVNTSYKKILLQVLTETLDYLYDGRIPVHWLKISWMSSTIGFWYGELLNRHSQISSWVFREKPSLFWMTGFFNPQGFLTAMKQEISRAHKGWTLDNIVLENEVTTYTKYDIKKTPLVNTVFIIMLRYTDIVHVSLVSKQSKTIRIECIVTNFYCIQYRKGSTCTDCFWTELVGTEKLKNFRSPCIRLCSRKCLSYIYTRSIWSKIEPLLVIHVRSIKNQGELGWRTCANYAWTRHEVFHQLTGY